MKAYVDDDSIAKPLVGLLRKAHWIVLPGDVALAGRKDVDHLTFAVEHGLVLLTRNAKDYEKLARLVIAAGGHHPGILLVKADDNRRHNMKSHDIVRAIGKLENSGVPVADHVITLNQWR